MKSLRTLLALMVSVAAAALVLYPWYYLALPESRRILADLPQDLLLVLAGEIILAPAVWWLLWRREVRRCGKG